MIYDIHEAVLAGLSVRAFHIQHLNACFILADEIGLIQLAFEEGSEGKQMFIVGDDPVCKLLSGQKDSFSFEDLFLTIQRKVVIELAYDRIGYQTWRASDVRSTSKTDNQFGSFNITGPVLRVMVSFHHIAAGDDGKLVDDLVFNTVIGDLIFDKSSRSIFFVIYIDDRSIRGGGTCIGAFSHFPDMSIYFDFESFFDFSFKNLVKQFKFFKQISHLLGGRDILLGQFKTQQLFEGFILLILLTDDGGKVDDQSG